MNEKVLNIKEIYNFKLPVLGKLDNNLCVNLGFAQTVHRCYGYNEFDGYEIETINHKFYVLIENGQSCCERWGYISSNDQLTDFIGKTLIQVDLTDTALNKKMVEDLYCYQEEIQFVDFKFSDGDLLQLAVYNSHNGCYGHDILVLRDDFIILNNTL